MTWSLTLTRKILYNDRMKRTQNAPRVHFCKKLRITTPSASVSSIYYLLVTWIGDHLSSCHLVASVDLLVWCLVIIIPFLDIANNCLFNNWYWIGLLFTYTVVLRVTAHARLTAHCPFLPIWGSYIRYIVKTVRITAHPPVLCFFTFKRRAAVTHKNTILGY